ncbi:hypothetical protein GCM10011403_13250 [Pseudohongiella nitratireducens]|uniref:Uncharacterized protein n=1 Tax=Pseudohongiella nitratireducens TaxID=1768907 RepID=A0A917LU13_9GAMM|nr:hypothetical protein GCM10011403_13250 [Pseudohongiella nitratireducens]
MWYSDPEFIFWRQNSGTTAKVSASPAVTQGKFILDLYRIQIATRQEAQT